MKKQILLINIILIITSALILQAQNDNQFSGWDSKMIEDASTWSKLLIDYWNADGDKTWTGRKAELSEMKNNANHGNWADDAALMLAGGQASFENDINGAIQSLREVIRLYQYESTIMIGWDTEYGIRIDDSWLMYAPGLVSFNADGSVRKTRRLGNSILQKEARIYFEHIDKYPQLTGDVASYAIATMLASENKIDEAIVELESLIQRYPDLSEIRNNDFNAYLMEDGFLIGCAPPSEAAPINRVQYSACFMLLELYQTKGEKSNADQIAVKLATECSPDGWYWDINKALGNYYFKNKMYKHAETQYSLALSGLKAMISSKAARMAILYENGNMIKEPDFTTWENAAAEPFQAIAAVLENSIGKCKNN